MTLAEILPTLNAKGALSAHQGRNMQTSLTYLAHALGYASLAACPVGDACLAEPTWGPRLETHFATLTAKGRTISPATKRNTRNNLRVVVRLMASHGLLPHPLPSPLRVTRTRTALLRDGRATAPYQTSYQPQGVPRCFGLPQAEWPDDVVQGFRDWHAKGGFRLRPPTVRGYVDHLALYLGYIVNACHRVPAWSDLFERGPLAEFVRWHAERLKRPTTAVGHRVVRNAAAMAIVLERPEARALADFRNALPPLEPLHVKRDHMVTLQELEAVADDCLRLGRTPVVRDRRDRHPMRRRATRFQHGVMLKLLVRVPLRQRNIREMRLGKNLYQDPHGHWWLHFTGSELKIGTRGAQVNEYKLNLSKYDREPYFLPVLEEFLREYRPRLPGPDTSPFCFITWAGNPYTASSLRKELFVAVARRTGKRFYPHLIRTIWATEMLEKTKNYAMVATLLGDTIRTVMKTYYAIDQDQQVAIASDNLSAVLRTG